MGLETTLKQQSNRVLSILRIVMGVMFLAHGTSKFFDVPPWPFSPVTFLSLVWLQGLIELVGGSLLALGLFTRATAFVLSGDMAVAYFMTHAPKSIFPHANGGALAVVYCLVFFYLIFAGGGPWSLDRLVRKSEA